MTFKAKKIHRPILAALVLTVLLAVLCAQATAQLVALPKYDVSITVTPDPVVAGAQAHVESHVTLLYYQMGKDPSVPDIYVEYELKGPSGYSQQLAISGTTDSRGYHSADFKVPSAEGEYALVARAYDIAGQAVNGQNEARFIVKKGAVTVATPTVSPSAEPLTPTPVTPTMAPPEVTPKAGGGLLNLGSTEILLIGGAIVVLVILALLVIAALAVFFLLRRKKKAVPAAAPAPAVAETPALEAPRRYCMHCGSPMAMDDAKCPKCGQTPPSGVDTKECTSCHTVIPEPAKFCHKCGAGQLPATK